MVLSSERADPHRHGDDEGAYRNQRNDILQKVGHGTLLIWMFLLCSISVLFSTSFLGARAVPCPKG
jgi:hypothetical protein